MKNRAWFLLVAVILLPACSSFWNARPPDVLQELNSGGSIVAFNQSGSLLASGDWKGGVILWGVPEGRSTRRWDAHDGTVNGLAFLDQGSRLLSAGYDGALAIWDLKGRLVERIETPSPVMHLVADDAAGMVVTGHKDGVVRTWSKEGLQLLASYPLHDGAVKAVALQPGSGTSASSGNDGNVFVLRDGEDARELESPPTDAWALLFSPDGERLFGSGWFRLYRWDLDGGELLSMPTEHHGLIRSLHFSPSADYLASISRQTDSAVLFLDPETGEVISRFQKHALCGAYVAVSPDGRFLATTSDDATVRIWDLGKEPGGDD